MNPAGFRLPRNLLIAGLLAVLAGCAGAPGIGDAPPGQAVRAQQADVSGRHAEAAELWEQAADASGGAQRHAYLLRAAEAWWQAGDREKTRVQLARIDNRELASRELSHFALLQAELALDSADAEAAGFYLAIAGNDLSANQRRRFRALSDRLGQLRINPAGHALASAAAAISAMGAYDLAKGLTLLQRLEDVPSGMLRELKESGPNELLPGAWPDLALRVREAVVAGPDMTIPAFEWAAAHPGHEISGPDFFELGEAYRNSFPPPSRVAVLLPGDGGLAAAGAAIRDGLVSAFLENPRGSSLRFYPTGENPQTAVSAYFQAMGDGAEWIIGPLRRESVQALAELGSLGAPVLALNNFADSGQAAPGGLLFSLSLSQEEEARAIARKMLEAGQMRAISLAVDNPWGGRMEKAFVEAFTAAEGEIVTAARFSPAENDHSGLLTELLQIDESHERRNRLQATVGVPLAFEPSRRDDFDVFFLAADPEQGRQIRPQLRFHDAGEKPVLAVGRIHSGELNPARDQDLDGVIFPSTAWQPAAGSDSPAPEFQSLRGGSLGSLFAVGSDAWNVIAWLPLMKKDPDLVFSGAVGALQVAGGGRLERQPEWRVFTRGLPQVFQWPATAE
jgi:outer membrane PBP1 activator LpoA protein